MLKTENSLRPPPLSAAPLGVPRCYGPRPLLRALDPVKSISNTAGDFEQLVLLSRAEVAAVMAWVRRQKSPS